jgi:hypothetical protein
MKLLITLLLTIIHFFLLANMASPLREGTLAGTAFSSRNIDIIKERINITTSKDFKTANYVIEYFINTDTSGIQIPLLFLAKDFNTDFKVWLDDNEITLKDVPKEYKTNNKSPLQAFSRLFNTESSSDNEKLVYISWGNNMSHGYLLSDLKYFEIDLKKGKHNIRVEYLANVWINNAEWTKEYTFRYSLSPAKYWRSFDSLEVVINNNSTHTNLKCNLDASTQKGLNASAEWKFNKLPVEFIELVYIPEIPSFAKALIAISPLGLTVIFGLLITTLHFIRIIKFRKHNFDKKFSWVAITGSIINPALFLIFYLFSYSFIDSLIGSDASTSHGYLFLVIFLFPVLVIVYIILALVYDDTVKSNAKKRVNVMK